jgi:hypothetical protein
LGCRWVPLPRYGGGFAIVIKMLLSSVIPLIFFR